MSGTPFGFPTPAGPYSGLRRSVIDPETGQPVVTSAAAGELRPDPNAITDRSLLLPLGRTAAGDVVPAAQAPVKFVGEMVKALPGLATQAIEAAQFPGQVYRGEASIFDPATGHVSDEAIGKALDIAGTAMTGSLPLKAPRGALRSFGGAAKGADDLFADLEAGLATATKDMAPEVTPRSFVDPAAKSWDLYHGTAAPTDFARFRTDLPQEMRPNTVGSNQGQAVFFSPSTDEAAHYALGRRATGAGVEAGPRTIPVTVDPGKTGVLDMVELAQRPDFADRVYAAAVASQGNPTDPAQLRSIRNVVDLVHQGQLDRIASAKAFNEQYGHLGVSETPTYNYMGGGTDVAVQMAREQGLDTAIIRGLHESNGGDQVIALTPGRVRGRYSDELLFSGGPGGAGLGLGAAALAPPSDAQAAPPSQGAPSVTGSPFGLPAGFRAMPIPNADPDDPRRLLRQAPFDPSQPPPLVPVQGIGEQAGAVGEASAAPPGRAGLAFAGAPMPFSVSSSDLAAGRMPGSVPVAMDEAETRRLERATGMVSDDGSPSALPPVLPRHQPTPQPGPARAGLASAALSSPAADLPAPGAQPMMAAPQATPAPAPGAGPATAAPAAEEPGFFDKLMGGIQQSNGLLTHIGASLMSTPGFGAAVGAGLKSHQSAEQTRAVTDLARARFGMEARKAGREAQAENATARLMSTNLRIPYEQALGLAANKEFVNAYLSRSLAAPEGWMRREDGSLAPIPGGPQDPATKEQQAAATARGTESAKPDKPKWSQLKLDGGGTILYNEADPGQNQFHFPGQKTRPATDEELQAYGLQPGQAARWSDKDGPVPIGQPERPETRTIERPDGTKETRVLNRRTGQWDPPQLGGGGAPSGPLTVANPFSGGGKFNNEQGRAAGFTDRMMGSEETLRELEDMNSGFGGGIAGAASNYTPNILKSSDRQRFEQAQRDFVNSQLRRESGAAISEKEFDNARKQYFPQPGDGADVIEQKRQNRQRSIEAMGREGGPSYRPRSVFDPSGAIVPYRPPTAAPAATSAAPSRALIEAEARKRGLIP